MNEQPNTPRPWATVTDSKGQSWLVRITLAQAVALRTKRKVDLLASDSGKTAMQLAADPIALVEVAYDVTNKQREEAGIVEESQFLELFDGDSWQDLLDATVEGIIDFFPSSQRTAIGEVWRRQKSATSRATGEVAKRLALPGTLDAMDREADRAIAEFHKKLDELGTIRS